MQVAVTERFIQLEDGLSQLGDDVGTILSELEGLPPELKLTVGSPRPSRGAPTGPRCGPTQGAPSAFGRLRLEGPVEDLRVEADEMYKRLSFLEVDCFEIFFSPRVGAWRCFDKAGCSELWTQFAFRGTIAKLHDKVFFG